MAVSTDTIPDQAGEPAPTGLVEDVLRLSQDIGAVVHEQVQLAVLETRYSVNGLLTMLVTAIVMALLLVSAWLALLGAAAVGLMALGVSAGFALAVMAAINLLLLPVGLQIIRNRSRTLGWPATLRALQRHNAPASADATA